MGEVQMPSSRGLPDTHRKGLIDEPLASILRNDDNLYGIDEILSLSIVNVYGSIGLTNLAILISSNRELSAASMARITV